MQTRVSTRGQLVLPGPNRRSLGTRAGDPLDAEIDAGSVILTPLKKRPNKGRIIADPVTGLPVLSAGADAPVLSSKEVEETVANFP
jgi:AbrB family looped-hinge helix DNA binding protein